MNRGLFFILITITLYWLLGSCAVTELKGPSQGAFSPTEDFGCVKCHSPGEVTVGDAFSMHDIHFAQLGDEANCDMCHPTDASGNFRLEKTREGHENNMTTQMAVRLKPYYQSWAGSDFLDNKHNQNKVDCVGCHETLLPENPSSMEYCFKCHGSYAQIAELTNTNFYNPHESHVGELECMLCHKGHEKFQLYCNECHEFDSTD